MCPYVHQEVGASHPYVEELGQAEQQPAAMRKGAVKDWLPHPLSIKIYAMCEYAHTCINTHTCTHSQELIVPSLFSKKYAVCEYAHACTHMRTHTTYMLNAS